MKGSNDTEKIAFKRSRLIRTVFAVIILVVLITLAAVISSKAVNKKLHGPDSVYELELQWNLKTLEGYKKAYEISSEIISENPYHNTARAYHGYASFMLSQYENDSDASKRYLEEAINNLRVAFVTAREGEEKAQIAYILGHSYFSKDRMSSFLYYENLVIKYLTYAKEKGYESDDIPLLLGLSYAALGDKEKSIESFTQALLVKESDTLLFNIAKQYFLNNQPQTAKQYLLRVTEMTKNDELLESSKILLGQIFITENRLEEAEKEFLAVLEKNDLSADAHYELGIIYEKLGDSVKARSEWRKCLMIQPNYNGEKISDLR